MAAVETSSSFTQPKFVGKAFALPIVSDTCSHGLSTASTLTSPLQPYLSSLASLTQVVETQLSHLLTLGEERLPELVTSRVRVARDQVSAGVQYLDSTFCSGLDQLVVKVPSLQSPSPVLYSSTREAAVSQLTLASTYLASFTLAQLALKVSDASLESVNVLLKRVVPATYTSQCEPLVDGIKKVRRHVEEVRREGARANGSKKVADKESSSSLSAVCEVFGLGYILNIFGVSKVVAEVAVAEVAAAEAAVTEAKMDVSGQSGATAEVGKIRAFTVDQNGTVVNEIFNDMSVEDEAIVDLPVLMEGKKSKKAYKY